MDRNVLNWFVIIFIYSKCQNLKSTWPWLFFRRHPAIWRPVVYWMDWATSINRLRKFECRSRSNFPNKLTKQGCILVGQRPLQWLSLLPRIPRPPAMHAPLTMHTPAMHTLLAMHAPCHTAPPPPCTPPCHTRHPPWTEWHTLVKTLPFRNYRLITTVADGKRRDWYLNSWHVNRRNKTILNRVCQEFSTFSPRGFWWQLINNWSWRRMKVLFKGQEQLHCANLCLTFCTRWTSKNGVT